MYKLFNFNGKNVSVIRLSDNASIPLDEANTDYQAFKSAILNQQLGGAVVEDGDSFGLNVDPNESILEDADGVKMTIDQAQEYARTLP